MKRFYCAYLFTMKSWNSNTDVGTNSSYYSSVSSHTEFQLITE